MAFDYFEDKLVPMLWLDGCSSAQVNRKQTVSLKYF